MKVEEATNRHSDRMRGLTVESSGGELVQRRVTPKAVNNAADIDAAGQLASALGLMAQTASFVHEQDEERYKKVGIADAERVAAATTREDWLTKSNACLLNDYGVFKTSENPYAVAILDKIRGQELSEELAVQYEEIYSKLPWDQKPKTAAEGAQQFQDFLSKRLQEYQPLIKNQGAFDEGWTSNVKSFIKGHVNRIVQEQSAYYDAGRKTGYTGVFNTLAANIKHLEPGQTLDTLQKHLNEMALTANPAEVASMLNNALGGIIKNRGQAGFTDFLFENLKVRNWDGRDVPLMEILDPTPFRQLEVDTYSQGFPKELSAWMKKTNSMDALQLEAEWRRIETDLTPEGLLLKDLVSPNIKSLIKQREQQDIVRQYNLISTQNEAKAKEAFLSFYDGFLDAQIQTSNHGDSMYMGIPVTTGLSEIIKLFNYNDAEGGSHAISLSEGEKMMLIQAKAESILTDERVPEKERANNYLHFLSLDVASEYRKSLEKGCEGALADLRQFTDKDILDPKNNKKVLQVSNHVSQYANNPSAFRMVFGKEFSDKIAFIKNISESTGSIEGALIKYNQAASVIDSPTFKNDFNKLYSEAIGSFYIHNSDTKMKEINFSLAANLNVADRLNSLVEMEWAAGRYSKMEDCIDAVYKKEIEPNYLWVNASLIPRALFDIKGLGEKLPEAERNEIQHATGTDFLKKTLVDIAKEANEKAGFTEQDAFEDLKRGPGGYNNTGRMLQSTSGMIQPDELTITFDSVNGILRISHPGNTVVSAFNKEMYLQTFKEELLGYYQEINNRPPAPRPNITLGGNRRIGREGNTTLDEIHKEE